MMKITHGKDKRITIISPDQRYIATLWKRGRQWTYSIEDVWDQGTQKAFIKAFKKTTGKVRGCLVFVLPDMTVKTYFLKDLKGVDKARKGFSVQTFDQKKDGTD